MIRNVCGGFIQFESEKGVYSASENVRLGFFSCLEFGSGMCRI